ncbi:secreted Ly-6/uPAR-related protein 1-like [Dendrobates tinctorius]|uniref:secreted Ly-6/uPAR-related protein 1-like n=1 Tax=Dendrobates tinctorius TaxID=92724 RepID=UPI003CC9FB8B
MITTGIFLVTLALFCKTGESLMCYYCPDATYSSECTDTRNCTAAISVCKTTVLSPDVGYPFEGNEVVTRGCSTTKTCFNSSLDELGNSQIVFCCSNDLCNNRGLNGTSSDAVTHIHTTTQVLLLGVLVPLTLVWP